MTSNGKRPAPVKRAAAAPRSALLPAVAEEPLPAWLIGPELPADWLTRHRAETLHLLLTARFVTRVPVGAFQAFIRGLGVLDPLSEAADDVRDEVANSLQLALTRGRVAPGPRSALNRLVSLVNMMAATRSVGAEFAPEEWEAWGVAPGSSRAASLAAILEDLWNAAGVPTATAADPAVLFWATAAVVLFAAEVLPMVASEQPAFAEYAADVRCVLSGRPPSAERTGSTFDYVRDLASPPPLPKTPERPYRGWRERVRLRVGGNYAHRTWASWMLVGAASAGLLLASLGAYWNSRGSAARDAFTREHIEPYRSTLGLDRPPAP